MRPLISGCLAAGLLLLGYPATAADNNFYIGVGAGQANVKVDDVLGIYGANFDEDDTGFKVFGGYTFLPWLGVEVAYVDGGSPSLGGPLYDDGTGEVKLEIGVQSFLAAAVFTLPLGEKFELFIKPGIAYWKSDTSLYVNDPVNSFEDRLSQDDDDTAFYVGGGAAFNFSDNFGVRLEYEWFEVTPKWDEYNEEFVQELDASASLISASLVYRF